MFTLTIFLILKALNEIDYKKCGEENTNIFFEPWIMDHASWIITKSHFSLICNTSDFLMHIVHCLCDWIKAHNQSYGKCEMGLTVFYKIHTFCNAFCVWSLKVTSDWITFEQNPNGFERLHFRLDSFNFQVSFQFDFLYILWINYQFPFINIQYWVWA